MPKRYICSNKDCNPLHSLGIGTAVLVRRYRDDPTTLRCPQCKREYDTEILTEDLADPEKVVCPRCGVPLKPKKTWYLKCPECGRTY